MIVPVLRQGDGVEFSVIAPGGFRILAALDHCTQVIDRDLVITAGTDHHHDGRHVTGEAFDVRVKDFDVPTILRLRQTAAAILGPRFTVLYEVPSEPTDPQLKAIAFVNGAASGPHLHVQVKRGTVYPPTVEIGGVPL